MEKEIKKRYSVLSNQYFIYSHLWQYDKKAIGRSLLEVVTHILVALGGIALPALIVSLLEKGVTIEQLIIKILGCFIGYGLICSLETYLVQRNTFQFLSFRMEKMMGKAVEQVMRMDYDLYEQEKTQKLLQNGLEAVGGNGQGVEGIIRNDVQLLTAGCGLILYAIFIGQISPVIVGMLVVISMIQVVTFKWANRYEVSHQQQKAKLLVTQKYLDGQAETVSVGKDIRLYQLQDWLSNLYKRTNKKYQSLVSKEKSCYFANDLFGLLLQLGRDLVCYGYLIKMMKEGLDISQFIIYIGIVSGFSSYFSILTLRLSENIRYHKSVDFLREFIDLPSSMHYGEGKVLEEQVPTLEVVFSHVSFAYEGEDGSKKKVLDDISFKMKVGEKVALVGINGAGKTTIVKLLCGFYKPQSGHIYINGIDLSELDLESYYKDLAVVFQDSFTHSYSIADNVACCIEEEYSREQCVQSLKKAGLWEKIDALPKKEKTHLNKDIEADGIQLSGGQIQKLMLARALYKNCRLLLLDEPTAALDAIAENQMYEKYEELIAGKTALFISHRLASTRFCNKIIFLENGKIVEVGTHEELLRIKGRYAHMFEVQSQYYKEGEVSDEIQTSLA